MEAAFVGVDVCMIHDDLTRAPRWPMPDGYTMRTYREGDAATWVRLQHASADDLAFLTPEHFARDMPGDAAYLEPRVMFLVDPSGADIGTITAWNDARIGGHEMGHIHWVAIVTAMQGRGLSKPMLSAAIDVLRTHGYKDAYLETNTRLTPALNLYLAFGFRPLVRSEAERDAWRAAAPQLKFPLEV